MKSLLKITLLVPLLTFNIKLICQDESVLKFITDPSLKYGSVSLAVIDAETGNPVITFNHEKSLIPASVAKLITSAAALEILGPAHTFKTIAGYTGNLDRDKGILSGDIIIRGGGDPALGSEYFSDHYGAFIDKWADEIRGLGIRRVEGRVIVDDSYYDYQPVPGKWLWEDAGNYYGAGVYGLSIFDNTYRIHFATGTDSGSVRLLHIDPPECGRGLINRLQAGGDTDMGYVFAAPYSEEGWIEGTIPAGRNEFILKASISDPPMLLAELLSKRLTSSGITVNGNPSTARIQNNYKPADMVTFSVISSPPLSDILKVLNHESVNLFAEHLLKELGKFSEGEGTSAAGIRVIGGFINSKGLDAEGLFLVDGSGLSPLNGISSGILAGLLVKMKKESSSFPEFYSSLPDAGKNGTLKNYFRDDIFANNLKAKTGSMTRVRSFAGYFTTNSGKEMAFSVIVNNFTGPSKELISAVENLLREIILRY